MDHKILLVDDDEAIRRPVRRFLERAGFAVCEAGSASGGQAVFDRERPDAVLLDYALPDGDAMTLLPRFKASAPEVPVVILTGHGTVETAVLSLKGGADDFLTKPIEMAELARILGRMLDNRGPRAEEETIDPFVGSSKAVRDLANDVRLAVRSGSPVLLHGETGSGKGVLARWIHAHGERSEGPFVALNCGGLAKDLLASELFGHTRGAFTGAVRDKPGLFEAADGGTLFLDEIGDLDLDLQPKLLTVLDDQSYRRVGEVRERRADLRLVTATNRELGEMVRDQRFRTDLYFRISPLSIRVPSLRERRSDIAQLARMLLRRVSPSTSPELTAAAAEALAQHDWPGNFRELRNVLERAILASGGAPIEPEDLRFDTLMTGAAPAARSLEQAEQQHIEAALRIERGHVTRTAQRLGLARSTLYEKLNSLGLDPADFRPAPGSDS